MHSDSSFWNIYRLSSPLTDSQHSYLREIANLWRQGEEVFWPYEEIVLSMARSEIAGFGAEKEGVSGVGGAWDGFLLAEVGLFHTELLYLYIRPQCRRLGLGQKMLEYLLHALQKTGTQEALFLEVRSSNEAAQRLYRNMGMIEVGKRRGYYANGEDALVFKKDLTERKP